MDVLKVVGAAFAGGLVSVLAGWFNAATPWNWRKAGASLIRIAISAATFATTFNFTVVVTGGTKGTKGNGGSGTGGAGNGAAGNDGANGNAGISIQLAA